jgi:saccharopine dehydrogenase-like NADP-dependent oxidoreductase
MRVIVLGGAGNFGARILRALGGDPTIDLLVAGRRSILVPGAEDARCAGVDIGAPDFTQQLRAWSPELVIHYVGPFQGQDYRVATAALAAGAHYLDFGHARKTLKAP